MTEYKAAKVLVEMLKEQDVKPAAIKRFLKKHGISDLIIKELFPVRKRKTKTSTPKKDVFSFEEQLKVGDRGEALFLKNYPAELEIFKGREYDFICKKTKDKIEIKSDTYDINKTEFFFFERYSDVHKETPGGPWRTYKDKVDRFCYVFVNNNKCFEFADVKSLIKRLEWLTKKMGLVYIKNRGWTTAGYKIKREDVRDLYSEWDWDDNNNATP